tara:strand:- start:442 stop:855 length:414 start_codon:yes stop_codon:yes gene_type:complete
MAVTFSRTTGSGGVMTVTIELELYAGALVDGTRWLDGAGGAADDYPGSLNPFLPTNTDTTNTAGRGLKLIVGTFTLVEDNNVFTIGGDADTVHAIVVGGSGVAGKSLTVDAGIGTSAITMQAEGTLNSQTHFMAIVS